MMTWEKQQGLELGSVAYTYNHNPWKAETGELLQAYIG